MKYECTGDEVTIRMSRQEFAGLMFRLGKLAGAASRRNSNAVSDAFRLANDLNNGNPEFIPYAIPLDKPKKRK